MVDEKINMHTHTNNFGQSVYKEARLCFGRRAAPYDGADSNWGTFGKRMSENASELASSVYDQVKRVLNIEGRSAENLQSEAEWIRVFEQDDIFVVAQKPISSLRNVEIGPREYLKTLSVEERRQLFARFMRTLVPNNVFEEYFGNRKKIGNPGSSLFEIMRDVQQLLIGRRITVPKGKAFKRREKIAIDIAKKSVVEHYTQVVATKDPEKDLTEYLNVDENRRAGLPMFSDYEKLVHQHQLNDRERIEPNVFLSLSSDEPNMFLAGIRTGIITRNHLEQFLAPCLRTKEVRTSRERTQVQEEVGEATSRLRREQIRMETSNIVQNYHSMSGGAKVLLWGALGYATWKMLKSENKYIKTLPFLPVGYYFYQRLVKGDPNALNNMGVGLKGVIDRLGHLKDKGLEVMGFETDQEDPVLMYMQEASTYAEENDLSQISTTLVSAISEVKLSTIVENMKDGRVNLDRGSTLYTEFTRTFDGDDRYILKLAKDPVRNKLLYYYLEDLMLKLGGLQRPDLFDSAEGVMDEYGVTYVPRDLGRITDPTTRTRFEQDYELLVNLGKNKAARTKTSLGESLGDFIGKPERERPNIDNAQRVEEPLRLPHRQAELAMYNDISNYEKYESGETSREKLLEDKGLIHNHITESINNLIQMELVQDGAARAYLEQVFISAIEGLGDDSNDDLPLRDIVLRIEKLEYALLIYCLNNDNVPMDVDALRALADDPGTDGLFDRFMSAVNREVYYVSSRAHTVENLDNVQSILTEQWFTQSVVSMNNRGFDDLMERIETYQSVFNTLKNKGPLNPSFIVKYDFDSPEDFDQYAKARMQLPARADRIRGMERYFAQLLANEVLLAMLTTHVRTGIHDFDQYAPMRQITPHEEQNIMDAGDRLLEKITGINPNSPEARTNDRSEGEDAFWEMLELIDPAKTGANQPTGGPNSPTTPSNPTGGPNNSSAPSNPQSGPVI